MTRTSAITPVRRILRAGSSLLPKVQDGLGALPPAHRTYLDDEIRSAFADSLDADDGLRAGRDQENRWDYLLGHTSSGQVVGVEPHSAREDQIGTVIRKRMAARDQLREHLRDGATVSRWFWVASGKVHFAETEKVKFRLDQNGVEFVGKRVMAKHLPGTAPSVPRKTRTRRG